MEYLKMATTIFNVLLALIFIFFSGKLRWKNEAERPSIIGFTAMILLYALNSWLIWS